MMRYLMVRDAKAKNDIYVPLSSAIARELKRARNAARARNIESEYVFPGRIKGSHVTKFSGDGLPAYGKMYRHIWRTVAAEEKIDETIAQFCVGHIPEGVSRGYIQKMMLMSGEAMKAAQRKVSRRMLALMP
jgi:hypothetical protein